MLQVQDKIDIERITDYYLVSNTVNFLYRKFRGDDFVQKLGQKSVAELKSEFVAIASKSIDSIQELSYAYAIYIAFTFKPYDEAIDFYNNEGDIGYEWFPDIKSIFVASTTPHKTFNFTPSLNLTYIPKYSIIKNRPNDTNHIPFKELLIEKTHD